MRSSRSQLRKEVKVALVEEALAAVAAGDVAVLVAASGVESRSRARRTQAMVRKSALTIKIG